MPSPPAGIESGCLVGDRDSQRRSSKSRSRKAGRVGIHRLIPLDCQRSVAEATPSALANCVATVLKLQTIGPQSRSRVCISHAPSHRSSHPIHKRASIVGSRIRILSTLARQPVRESRFWNVLRQILFALRSVPKVVLPMKKSRKRSKPAGSCCSWVREFCVSKTRWHTYARSLSSSSLINDSLWHGWHASFVHAISTQSNPKREARAERYRCDLFESILRDASG